MNDRKAVIDGLKRYSKSQSNCLKDCYYAKYVGCSRHLAADTLKLVKKQEEMIEIEPLA